MAQKYEIKKTAWARLKKEKRNHIKYWQNKTLAKSNFNCEKYTKNIKLYDNAEIFFKKIQKKKKK